MHMQIFHPTDATSTLSITVKGIAQAPSIAAGDVFSKMIHTNSTIRSSVSTPRRLLHPSQRKLLETVYEAFESSGTPLEKLSGSRTGAFVGNFNRDYWMTQHRDTEYSEPYSVTGSGDAILSNRINHVFNLTGPSMTIDTACSSSLYAMHLACSALQNGECDGAIVAGCNLILAPDARMFSASLGTISATSRCNTFDQAADGYARANGIGALYVKRLTDAERDRDPIRAVIRGSAINA